MISNIILGVILIIFSVFFGFQVVDLPERSALFPSMILWGIGITGILMVLTTLWKYRKEIVTGGGPHEQSPEQRAKFNATMIYQIIIPGLILLATYGLLVLFGFYPGSFFLVFVIYGYHAFRMDPQSLGARLLLKALIFSLIITVSMYLIFSLMLGLPAPSGTLF